MASRPNYAGIDNISCHRSCDFHLAMRHTVSELVEPKA